jgi:ElaB/YqjD/DUF883 family membrane-anchored ribosome-binding protein
MSQNSSVVMRDQLIEQFHSVVADTEQLLKTVASAGGDKVDAMRAAAEQSLKKAKERLHDLQHAATEKAGEASDQAHAYVHEHPWQAIGAAASFTIAAGLVIGLLLRRH